MALAELLADSGSDLECQLLVAVGSGYNQLYIAWLRFASDWRFEDWNTATCGSPKILNEST